MAELLPIEKIKERSTAIGVSLKVLAKEAGISPGSAYRGARGTDNRGKTLRLLTAALLKRESEVREHFQKIDKGDK